MASLSYGQEIEEQPTYIQDLNFGSLTTTAGEIFNYDQLAGKSRVYLFFSKDCGNCQITLEELKASAVQAYPYVQVFLFEVNQTSDGEVNRF